MGACLCGMEEEAARSCCQAPLNELNKMSKLKELKATYTPEKIGRIERFIMKMIFLKFLLKK